MPYCSALAVTKQCKTAGVDACMTHIIIITGYHLFNFLRWHELQSPLFSRNSNLTAVMMRLEQPMSTRTQKRSWLQYPMSVVMPSCCHNGTHTPRHHQCKTLIPVVAPAQFNSDGLFFEFLKESQTNLVLLPQDLVLQLRFF